MKIAAVNWLARPVESENEFFEHLTDVVAMCGDADLIVLPECIILELCNLLQGESEPAQVRALAGFAPRFEAELTTLAKQSTATLVGGSYFRGDRAHGVLVATPDGELIFQGKQVLTQFELQDWGLTPHSGLARQVDPRLGTLVCYDSEFPEAGRALAESGVLVLAVPAYTETSYGFHRVRTGCAARALENQIITVHASLVGGLGFEPIVQSTGSSAILAPSIEPFPAGGVLAETPHDVEAVALAEVDLDALLKARQHGDVRNWNDRHAASWTFRD